MEGLSFGVVGGQELGLIHIKFEMSIRHIKMSRRQLTIQVWQVLGRRYKIESSAYGCYLKP